MLERGPDLRLIGYAQFKISALFLRTIEDEIRVSQWGPRRNPRITVHRCPGIRTGEALRAEIEQPCSVSVISGHGEQDDTGALWLGKDPEGKTRLYLDEIRRVGATNAVVLDACLAPLILPELARNASPGTILIGLADTYTDGRNSVTVLADVLRELCYPRSPDLDPPAVMAAVERVDKRIEARNRLASERDQTPRLFVHRA